MKERDKELCKLKFKNNVCLLYDSIGTVRTGREWFDRYMIFPWEKGNDFSVESYSRWC